VHSTENKRSGADRGRASGHGDRSRSAHPFAGAQFLTTAAAWNQLPAEGAPEVAFAGRSNAGKSSAINALAQHTRLAYVSKTPGRTQHINFFRLRSGGLLADLPGYGYAAVPDKTRRHWQRFLAEYLSARPPLVGLVLVMDIRHALTALDRQMLDWFLPSGRPTRILLAKADKYPARGRGSVLAHVRESLSVEYALYAGQLSAQIFSATRSLGIGEAGATILSWLEPPIHKERPRHQGE
jgi:GTP-binding protein